jgi:hypothetical protein
MDVQGSPDRSEGALSTTLSSRGLPKLEVFESHLSILTIKHLTKENAIKVKK